MSRCRQLTLLVIALLVAGAAARRVHAQESAESDSDAASKPPKDYEKGDEGSYIRKRMTWFHDQRAYPHKTIPPGVRMRAFKQMQAKEAAEAAARARQPQHPDPNQPANVPIGSWQMIGPQPDDGFGLANSGRVAAAVVDPTNNQTVYVGAAQGGVWKTTDGGTTWTPLTDTQASLAVGSIALDPENHNTIYVGTGEENNSGDSYYGAGILKSTDGGNTWTNYPGPFGGGAYGGARIGGIAVHPTNSNIVLAAVGCCNSTLTSGVYRSTDGGQTWTNTANVNDAQAYNVIFNPTNGNIVYASFDSNGVYSSTDGGQTWVPDNGSGASSLPTGSNTERVALAMDPNNPSTLYAGIGAGGSNFGQLYGLYKTTNAGLTWTQLTNAPNYCSGQCWYAM